MPLEKEPDRKAQPVPIFVPFAVGLALVVCVVGAVAFIFEKLQTCSPI